MRPLTVLNSLVKLNLSLTIRTEVLITLRNTWRKTGSFAVLGDGKRNGVYLTAFAVKSGAARRAPVSRFTLLPLLTARLAENMTAQQDLSIQLTFGRERFHWEWLHTDGALRSDGLVVRIGVAALVYGLSDSWPEGFGERLGRRSHVEKGTYQ
jgi:hypothetical protein